MTEHTPPKTQKQIEQARAAERKAQALRDNLRRRKQASKPPASKSP